MIHRFALIYFVAVLLPVLAKAQGGDWVWVSGPNTPNGTAVYGTKGVPSSTNTPQGLYEAAAWADKHGNFWIYGGVASSGQESDDLWKYDPVAGTWTWVKGSGTGSGSGTFGIQGVPSPANNPPGLGWGTSTWTDEAGDLWLYGGRGDMGLFGDLWRYNIATNKWTWMSGTGLTGASAFYGTKGVPSQANTPGQRQECTSNWVDGAGNLWLFGGYDGIGTYNDLWMFNTQTEMWTWVNGSGITNSPGNYGTLRVTSSNNLPPARCSYTNWKDASGNFYIFGGSMDLFYTNSDVWKYDPVANLWTWIAGEATTDYPGSYSTYCVNNGSIGPPARFENRTAQIASCQGNAFYSFGGLNTQNNSAEAALNDLWVFDVTQNTWTWVDGSNTLGSGGHYGTRGVASPSNQPPARCGQCMWADNAGNLWVFGGTVDFSNQFSDVWKFTPNPNCLNKAAFAGSGLFPVAANNPICIGDSTLITVTGGDSLQIWPATGARFIDSTRAMVSPDTTTTYLLTGHSNCKHNDTTRITIRVVKPGQLVYQLTDTNVCGTTPVNLHLTGQANTHINPITGVTVIDSIAYRLAPPVTTTYSITGTSTLCAAPDTATFTIHVTQPDPVTVTGNTTVCAGNYIVITTTGLTGLQCFNATYLSYSVINNSIVFSYGYGAATFPVVISGTNSCGVSINDTLLLVWADVGTLSFSASKAVICPGDSSLLAVNSPPIISVNPSASVTWINSNEAWLKPDSTTNYTIFASAACITDSGYQLITVSPQAHAAFTLTAQPNGAQTLITINNQSTGYSALSWYHDSALLTLTDNTIPTTDTGNYCITLIAVNNEGCDDSVTHCIEISGQSFLQVPQAFTPNGDGVNDYFTVYGKNLSSYQIRIYNRWGEEVYSSNDLSELNNLSRGWNGTYKGKLQDPASFTWAIKANDDRGNTIDKKGYVILIR